MSPTRPHHDPTTTRSERLTMKATLTRRTATSLPAPERGRIEYVDQKLPGFVLRVRLPRRWLRRRPR